jgi:hypothetical protein
VTSKILSRRSALAATVAVMIAGASTTVAAPAATASAAVPVRLTLPPPTGPRTVGTVSLHVVDRSRRDPWPGAGPARELMISLWYPTRCGHRYPLASWLPDGAARQMLTDSGLDPELIRVPTSHAGDGAPLERRGGRLPVVVYSPGNDSFRSSTTVLVEELASHGYLVVTIDHPGDAYVQFPDGRVLTPLPDGPQTATIAATRVADTRFVLDVLAVLDAGGNPDIDRHPLPAGLKGRFDLRRIGMVGHSAGAFTVAATMHADTRIIAGLSLDGGVYGPVVQDGLDRPYLLMDATRSSRATDPDLATFWSHLRGWRLNLKVTGAGHSSYTDEQALIPQLHLPTADAEAAIGTIDPRHALAIQRAYPRAFFDLHLRGRGRGHLLDAPVPRYPDVTFLP